MRVRQLQLMHGRGTRAAVELWQADCSARAMAAARLAACRLPVPRMFLKTNGCVLALVSMWWRRDPRACMCLVCVCACGCPRVRSVRFGCVSACGLAGGHAGGTAGPSTNPFHVVVPAFQVGVAVRKSLSDEGGVEVSSALQSLSNDLAAAACHGTGTPRKAPCSVTCEGI